MTFNQMPQLTTTETRSLRGDTLYSPPEVLFVGYACDIVLGPPGGGFDGPYGITEPEFEFEEDGSW